MLSWASLRVELGVVPRFPREGDPTQRAPGLPAALRVGSLCTLRRSDLLDGWREMNGADDETRTRDIDLGKVALYQLSYIRMRAE